MKPIIYFLILTAFTYLLFAFVVVDLNFYVWDRGTRLGFALLAIVYFVFALIFLEAENR